MRNRTTAIFLLALVLAVSACGSDSDVVTGAETAPVDQSAGEVPANETSTMSEDQSDEAVASDDAEGAEGSLAMSDEGEAVPGSTLRTVDFSGLTEAEAVELAESNGLPWRVVRVDEEIFAVTFDLRPNRLNFELDDGLVTGVSLG